MLEKSKSHRIKCIEYGGYGKSLWPNSTDLAMTTAELWAVALFRIQSKSFDAGNQKVQKLCLSYFVHRQSAICQYENVNFHQISHSVNRFRGICDNIETRQTEFWRSMSEQKSLCTWHPCDFWFYSAISLLKTRIESLTEYIRYFSITLKAADTPSSTRDQNKTTSSIRFSLPVANHGVSSTFLRKHFTRLISNDSVRILNIQTHIRVYIFIYWKVLIFTHFGEVIHC